MKTVTINVEGASQSQWSTFLLELNLMKKASKLHAGQAKVLKKIVKKK